MRTSATLVLFTLALASGWGQTGQNVVDFRNGGVTFPTEADRFVYRDHIGGEKLWGMNYLAGLWFAPGPDLSAVDCRIVPERGLRTGVDFPFHINPDSSVGYWFTPLVSPLLPLDGIEPGGLAALQVRVWDSAKFPSFQKAFEEGQYGVSEPFAYTVPPPGAPDIEYRMNNLRAFALVAPPSTNITIRNTQVAEGNRGVFRAEFTLQLFTAQLFPVSVDFRTVDGTAVAGEDFVATNGTVTFAPGETKKTVSVALIADAQAEPDEDFMLRLSNPVNGVSGKSEGVCTITEMRVVGVTFDAEVRFNTAAGHHYAVEWSLNLLDWQPLLHATNVSGTGGTVVIIDKGAGCKSYRTRELD